jgi:DNA mismatch endonuclease (patch repair protein)
VQNYETDPSTSLRMSRQVRRDTAPELRLRRLLFARGLRYRVDAPLPGMPRRRADVLFTRRRVAVFIDGCFWHSCPVHGTVPRSNRDWWVAKLDKNMARDRETDTYLSANGWAVLRFWEHEDMELAADVVEQVVRKPESGIGLPVEADP